MTLAQPPRTVALPTGWRRFLPGLDVLMHYQRSWLGGDVLAGVTVAAYLVPQVMAYAAIAGVPPVYGLVSCLAPFVVYAFVVGYALRQWRHFKLSELEGVRGDLGLPIEQDRHFAPRPFSQVPDTEAK